VSDIEVDEMNNIPGPAKKDPAEGSREIVDRELRRADGPRDATSANPVADRNPGDAAAAGTVGTGEAICPDCQGSGRREGMRCSNCGGSGRVVQAIGGG
jgi:hypothetical protein